MTLGRTKRAKMDPGKQRGFCPARLSQDALAAGSSISSGSSSFNGLQCIDLTKGGGRRK